MAWGSSLTTCAKAVAMWNSEEAAWVSGAGFSSGTGHFTQVWGGGRGCGGGEGFREEWPREPSTKHPPNHTAHLPAHTPQVVWKSTTHVGCAISCSMVTVRRLGWVVAGAGSRPPLHPALKTPPRPGWATRTRTLVPQCSYNPPGNMMGAFATNVQ